MKLDRVIAVRNRKTVYRDGDRCVKVFGSDYSKADILNEALNQACMEETGLHIPGVLEVTAVDGKWAIVSEYIKGKTLAQLMEDHPERKSEYISLLVDLQLEVLAGTSPLLSQQKDKMNRKLRLSRLGEDVRSDLHIRLEKMPEHDKVCHGDFNPSNIIIAEDGTPYILDWSHATRGNASADAATTYLLFRLNGDTEGAEAYLDIFCKKSNTDQSHVKKWMPLVAAAGAVKGNEKEREFLLSLVNAVDNE